MGGMSWIHWVIVLVATPAWIASYITPAVVSFRFGHRDRVVLTIVNVLFGWTILGWLFCFVWSLRAGPYRALVSA